MQQVFVFIQLNSFRERKDLKLGWPRGPLSSAEFAKGGSLGGAGASRWLSTPAVAPSPAHVLPSAILRSCPEGLGLAGFTSLWVPRERASLPEPTPY